MILHLLLGCVVKSTIELSKAKNVYEQAEQAGKAEVYPYEMTYAHSLLTKAWEEYSTANYDTANNLAQKSQDWVNKTRLEKSEHPQKDVLDKNLEDASKSLKDESKKE